MKVTAGNTGKIVSLIGETTTVRLWEIGATSAARLYARRPKSEKAKPKDAVWLPTSQIKHVRRYPAKPGEWTECEVEVADWLVRKHSLGTPTNRPKLISSNWALGGLEPDEDDDFLGHPGDPSEYGDR